MRTQTQVRQALARKLHAGATGTFEVLAELAFVPPHQAQRVLHGMCCEGCVVVVGRAALGRSGRPRAVYGLPDPADQAAAARGRFDALSFVRQVWR